MGENSKIEWTDHTFNPWIGCAKVSEGCKNCYAADDTPARVSRAKGLELWGPNAARKIKAESGWKEPLKWDRAAAKEASELALLGRASEFRRHRVFCASQADVFEDRPDLDEPRFRLLRLIPSTQHLDWLLLTKRPENVRPLLERIPSPLPGFTGWDDWCQETSQTAWLGVSVENRAAKPRIDAIRNIPAAVRFLSVEPLLEDLGELDLTGIDWVIVGGESGSDARPCDLSWIRSVVIQCRFTGVPCFVKQLGSVPMIDEAEWREMNPTPMLRAANRSRVPAGKVPLLLKDSKGGDWNEWPADLRVRQFPEAIKAGNEAIGGIDS